MEAICLVQGAERCQKIRDSRDLVAKLFPDHEIDGSIALENIERVHDRHYIRLTIIRGEDSESNSAILVNVLNVCGMSVKACNSAGPTLDNTWGCLDRCKRRDRKPEVTLPPPFLRLASAGLLSHTKF